MEIADVEFSDCTGTLKSLDEDLKNVIRKIYRFTEDTGEPMENDLIGGYNVILADQCIVWRQMIYRRQNYLYTKDKTDEADRKAAQQQADNLLRNSPLIKLRGKTNFLPWFGGVNELVENLPRHVMKCSYA